VQGTIDTPNGTYLIYLGPVLSYNSSESQVTAAGNHISATIDVPKLAPETFNIVLLDVTASTEATASYHVAAEGLAAIPIATLLIMLVAIAISFANMGLNRALITKLIGWREYHSMQKEMAEYNSQRMAAMRANDTRTLEKLKKKESQIQAMQAKLFKPQLFLIPITFIYLVIWPVLTGVFPFAVAYVPGFGAQPFFIWYLICSFFFGTIAGRVMGTTPIQ
jgi:uncharacterized membrane protein (DUF106 family)